MFLHLAFNFRLYNFDLRFFKIVENSRFDVIQQVLQKKSTLFCVPTSFYKSAKLVDSQDKIMDYFEKQVSTKKIDHRNRLELCFAVRECVDINDAIDEQYLNKCSSFWDEQHIAFEVPASRQKNEQHPMKSKDHTDQMCLMRSSTALCWTNCTAGTS